MDSKEGFTITERGVAIVVKLDRGWINFIIRLEVIIRVLGIAAIVIVRIEAVTVCKKSLFALKPAIITIRLKELNEYCFRYWKIDFKNKGILEYFILIVQEFALTYTTNHHFHHLHFSFL